MGIFHEGFAQVADGLKGGANFVVGVGKVAYSGIAGAASCAKDYFKK